MHTLFLPGASGSSDFWKPLADEMDGKKTLLSWPGLGNEPHDEKVQNFQDLVALAQGHIDGPVNIVAQSVGGAIAILLAANNPGIVERLALFVTSAGVPMEDFGASNWRTEYREAFPEAVLWIEDVRLNLIDEVKALEIPTLLFWGDNDPISPVSVGSYLQRLISKSVLHVVDGGDHDIGKTHAQQIAPIVKAHFDQSL